jgi:hypothetical protein
MIWSSGVKVPRSRAVRHTPVASAPPALWPPTESRVPYRQVLAGEAELVRHLD